MLIETYRKIVLKVAGYFFQKVFKRPMGKTSERFIENLSYIFLGTFLASMITFVLNFFVIRLLGPTEYGKFTLIMVISHFLEMPMLMGLDDSSTYHLAHEKNRRKIISTAFSSVFFLSVMVATFAFLFSGPIANIFDTSKGIVFYAIIMALSLVFFRLFHSIFRGLHMMKRISLLKVMQHVVIAAGIVIVLFVMDNRTVDTPFVSNLAGNIFAAVIMFACTWKYIFDFSKRYFSKLIRYGGVFFLLNLAIIILNNFHLIIVNAYLGLSLLGIYAAYLAASNTITFKLYKIFITVFFPTVSGKIDRGAVLKKINRISLLAVAAITLMNMVVISLFVYLYGSKYPFYLGLVIAFALDSALMILYRIDMFLLSAEGLDGVKKAIKGMAVITVLNILLNLVLVPTLGLYGGIFASIVTSLALIWYFKRVNRKLFLDQKSL